MLDHYLEVLARRPGALPGATALVTARASGLFSDTHERFWAAARRSHGDSRGTRVLIAVLLLHRTVPREAVLAGMEAALRLERLDADLVAVEARRHLEPAKPRSHRDGALTGDTNSSLEVVAERPPPSLDGYDTLLAPVAYEPAGEHVLEQIA